MRAREGGEAGRDAAQPPMAPVAAIGTFAAFGAFLGALAACLRLRLEDATAWAMHGMAIGGAAGCLIQLGEAIS